MMPHNAKIVKDAEFELKDAKIVRCNLDIFAEGTVQFESIGAAVDQLTNLIKEEQKNGYEPLYIGNGLFIVLRKLEEQRKTDNGTDKVSEIQEVLRSEGGSGSRRDNS